MAALPDRRAHRSTFLPRCIRVPSPKSAEKRDQGWCPSGDTSPDLVIPGRGGRAAGLSGRRPMLRPRGSSRPWAHPRAHTCGGQAAGHRPVARARGTGGRRRSGRGDDARRATRRACQRRGRTAGLSAPRGPGLGRPRSGRVPARCCERKTWPDRARGKVSSALPPPGENRRRDIAWLEFPAGPFTPRPPPRFPWQEPGYPPAPRRVSQPRRPRGPGP